eukprot:s3076_g12.t1
MFDGMVRRSFGDFTGLHPNALQWKQAALGLGHGGLSLRSTSDHASAAFLVSWASALQAGADLDVTFCPNEAKSARKLLRPLLASSPNSSLKLTSLWTMFSLANSTPCPSGWTMLAGRNNSDMLAAQPCFQKPPSEDGHSARRRPADVFLPAFAGSPSAIDFAITAPQRQETLAQASQKPLAAAAAYARHKEAHLQESTGAWDEGATAVLKHFNHPEDRGTWCAKANAALPEEIRIFGRSGPLPSDFHAERCCMRRYFTCLLPTELLIVENLDETTEPAQNGYMDTTLEDGSA